MLARDDDSSRGVACADEGMNRGVDVRDGQLATDAKEPPLRLVVQWLNEVVWYGSQVKAEVAIGDRH